MSHVKSLFVSLITEVELSKLFFHLHNTKTAFVMKNGKEIYNVYLCMLDGNVHIGFSNTKQYFRQSKLQLPDLI